MEATEYLSKEYWDGKQKELKKELADWNRD